MKAKEIRDLSAEEPVSYTHLDVYKRQAPTVRRFCAAAAWCLVRSRGIFPRR